MSLLVLIYLSFISLGLPDSLLGAAWPTMRVQLNAPLELAGPLAMVVSAGTIFSSLLSAKIIHRFGTGKVTLVSVAMTAIALIGYAVADAPWLLFLSAVPLGLGAGSVDAALNNYVSLHYEAKHMSWLHCFWGVGATIGPAILSAFIGAGRSYHGGYWTIIALQFALVGVLYSGRKLWADSRRQSEEGEAPVGNRQALKLKGIRSSMLTFFFYCSVETGMGLWIASYGKESLGMAAGAAALCSSMYYAGITIGRGLNGFLSMRCRDRTLIRCGVLLMTCAVLLMVLFRTPFMLMLCGILFGLGCAPVYPCMIHGTPGRFGAKASQAATGLQMASAYTGSTFMPPLFGVICGAIGMGFFPLLALVVCCMLIAASEAVRKYQKD